jgi:hypothetical protein
MGGREAVIEKTIEAVEVGNLIASPFVIQVGDFDYQFQIDGIVGLDFYLKSGRKSILSAWRSARPNL